MAADTQMLLADPDLGPLELGCDPYIVTQFQIGSPAVREVSWLKALADGRVDNTRFLGSRAITVAVRMKDSLGCNGGDTNMQDLLDRLVPYMHPRRRPLLSWMLPHSTERRGCVVRGDSWPFTLQGPRYQSIGLQWVVPDGVIFSGEGVGLDPVCLTIIPSADVEAGRTYDLTFDRHYPASAPIGGRTIDNPGTGWSDITVTLFGSVTNPELTVNGHTMKFNQNGGLTLLGGSSIVIDTAARTILLNGDADQSRYDRTNFTEWAWDDMRLQPGTNNVRFTGSSITATSSAQLCYRPVYVV